ncbi:site-specific DNA-methyltransferase [Candidatus Thorarchaeota archaeon]|nr:MAG: site-specific DNA-methyltransferase [Candidatus Thorarchaeota archaeon]
MRKIEDGSIDLIIADPPFGIDFDGKSGAYNRDENLVIDGYDEIEGDYALFSESWIDEAARLLSDTGSMYIFSGWNNLEHVLRGARLAGLHLLNHIIWQYQFGVFTKKKFVSSHYHILLLVKSSDDYFFNKLENYPQDVWRIKRSYRTGQSKNSTKLPTKVVQKCIEYSSAPGQIVLDPFMGNGTTAVAAKGSWRHFVGFETNAQLEDLILANVAAVELGQFYVPYSERVPSIEELARKYPRAYREYLKREKEATKDRQN